ncbi:hypothetical protein [Halobacillus salinus]|uniref:hypothetical protein n=1 Tax=Halobacillus salinus TaxID=192814 RepID=UPI0009A6C8F2|nr:hypothetical protein [Halobacillus salinus]
MNPSWKHELQTFVDELMEHVYQWPVHERSTIRILQLIERKQRQIDRSHFPDYGCYFLQLAQIIDHFLHAALDQSADLSWFCKYWETFDKENKLKLNNVIIEEKDNQRTFKKFVLQRDETAINYYCKSAIQCSYHMFQSPPDRIETFHLLSGQFHTEWSNTSIPS